MSGGDRGEIGVIGNALERVAAGQNAADVLRDLVDAHAQEFADAATAVVAAFRADLDAGTLKPAQHASLLLLQVRLETSPLLPDRKPGQAPCRPLDTGSAGPRPVCPAADLDFRGTRFPDLGDGPAA